jgi:small-conductance mechanosensitive channel
MAQPTNQAKLCPHCANSIALDALKCPYCKKELSVVPAQEWGARSVPNNELADTHTTVRGEKRHTKSLAIATAVLLLAVFAGVVWFGQRESGESTLGLAEKTKELQEKDQTIKTLEAELAKLREGNQGTSSQSDELRNKLAESQKDLAALEKKLADANREIERLTSNRQAAVPRGNSLPTNPPLPPPAPARRAAEPGIYETLRATSVYEEPSSSARVLTQVERATRVTVVRSVGDWLEVRSKHDNPPGYIRADDAMFVGRAN